MSERPTFYEFFAGGGMARLGLGERWQCLFANEWSARKATSYYANFPPATELTVGDIWGLTAADLPGCADLAWASFPCQDLSLAGNGAGLAGSRSGTLLQFWNLMRDLATEGRAVSLIALENVSGALTSNNGRDFEVMAALAAEAGYRFGAVLIDALQFLPQSRPRLFFIAVRESLAIPPDCICGEDGEKLAHPRVSSAARNLRPELKDRWIWWSLPNPPRRMVTLSDVIEVNSETIAWHSPDETRRLIEMMSEANAAKVRKAKAYRKRIVGTLYKRVRAQKNGKAQRAEVRFDQVSGCLRTPTGGSSRQSIVIVEGESVRSRLMTPREAARLMGLPDSYKLPGSYNEAYHLAGDGVAVPVVRFLAEHLLERLVCSDARRESQAA